MQYSGRAPLVHPLFSAPLVLAHLMGVPFYSFYLTKPALFIQFNIEHNQLQPGRRRSTDQKLWRTGQKQK